MSRRAETARTGTSYRCDIKNALGILVDYGKFRWPQKCDGFTGFTRGEQLRIAAWIDTAVRDGRLVKGQQRPRTWFGFTNISRLVHDYVDHAEQNRCANWDVTMSNCLSITIVAALGCRSGDVHLSQNYEASQGHFLQWRHIALTLNDNV